MIPVQIGPKAPVPVDAAGVTPPEKGSDADAFGFETQVRAEPDEPRGDGGWLATALIPEGVPTGVRQRAEADATAGLRGIRTGLVHPIADGGGIPGPVTADLAGQAGPEPEGFEPAVLPPLPPGQGAPAARSVFSAKNEQPTVASDALIGSHGRDAAGASAFADPGGDPDTQLPFPLPDPSSRILDLPSSPGIDDLPSLNDEAPDLPFRRPAALSPAAFVTDLPLVEPRSVLSPKIEAPMTEGEEAAFIPRSMPVAGAIEGAVRDALSRSEAAAKAGDPDQRAASMANEPERSIGIESASSVQENRSPGPVGQDRRLLAGPNVIVAPGVEPSAAPVEPGAFSRIESDGTLLSAGSSLVDPVQPTGDLRGGQGRTALPMVAGNPSPASLANTILGAAVSPIADGIEVALSPAELGHLRIELSQVGDGLRIVLSAERPETLDLLRRHADQLMAEVLDAGFSGAEMSFGAWSGPSDGDPSPRHHDDFATIGPDASSVKELAIGRFPILPAHHGGLNLRL